MRSSTGRNVTVRGTGFFPETPRVLRQRLNDPLRDVGAQPRIGPVLTQEVTSALKDFDAAVTAGKFVDDLARPVGKDRVTIAMHEQKWSPVEQRRVFASRGLGRKRDDTLHRLGNR
jgi:hypothetical protein